MLRNYLDIFCIAYLNNILIYSYCKANHVAHVSKVLKDILQHWLFDRLDKCKFHVKKVSFIGFIVTHEGIVMEPGNMSCITNWPQPKWHQDVQQFFGLANFYCQFIHGFLIISKPLSSLLVGAKASKFSTPFVMTDKARQAFAILKKMFVTAPLLAHFDPDQPLWLETDASEFAIASILLQPAGTGRVADNKTDAHWHPIAYRSQQKILAKQRYIAKDSNCLAIVVLFKQWRHYLKGAKYPILLLTDNSNLQT